jgi:protein TonB
MLKTENTSPKTLKRKKRGSFFSRVRHHFVVMAGMVVLTLLNFLVLPLMQSISKPPRTDLALQDVDTADLPPPPPPIEPEPEDEPEPEEKPPELIEDAQPLDLSQLELALNPGLSEGLLGGDFTVKLNTIGAESKSLDTLFSLSDLDQKPRVIYQPSPVLNSRLKKKAPGKVYILFIVDKAGRVKKPIVQKSSDPVFEKPALAAVKKWKFEPGKRNGEPVRFRMRVPITFPKG